MAQPLFPVPNIAYSLLAPMSLYFIASSMHRFIFGDLCILPLTNKTGVYVALLLRERDDFANMPFFLL